MNDDSQKAADSNHLAIKILSSLATIGTRLSALEKHGSHHRREIHLIHNDLDAIRSRIDGIEKRLSKALPL